MVCGCWKEGQAQSVVDGSVRCLLAGGGWGWLGGGAGGGGERRRAVPVGIMTDNAVAEADLMTLPPERGLRFSAVESPESCRRARRSTKSLVALGADGSSSFGGCGSPAFDLSPIGEWRERGDDARPVAQDAPPSRDPRGSTSGTAHPHHPHHPWRSPVLCPTLRIFLFQRLADVPLCRGNQPSRTFSR